MRWRRRRERRDWDWDDLFDDLYELFGREFEYFDEIAEKMFRDLEEFFKSFTSEGKPFIKGFSVRMGPKGKPEIKEFGSKAPGTEESEVQERKPLIDVIRGDEEVNVIIEMPGVNKEDIDINADENSVDVRAEGEDRRYSESVDLGCEVIPESGKARYNNGVLEIMFKRKEPRKKGKKVNIE